MIFLHDTIYLDNAATTAVSQAAKEAFCAACECFGNPSSLHDLGFSAERLVADSREAVAASIGAERGELIFTPGGTYADNFAILGAAKRYARRGGHIVTSSIEHPAVLETVRSLEKEGFSATYLAPDASGHISAEQVVRAVRDDTILVSLMLVNNELGTLQPVKEACRAVKRIRPEILFHTDAVQAYKKIPVNVRTLGVDLLSLSGHKVHAPKGIGALYVKKGVRLLPTVYGGGQERGLAPGTEPTPLIAALAAAAKAPVEEAKLNELREYALARLAAVCPRAEIVSPGEAGGIFALTVRGLRGETVMHALTQRGIYISTGSACGKGKPSHVFGSLPLERDALAGVMRVSVDAATTTADLDRFAATLAEVIEELRPKKN